jgi:transposase-like protein
MKGHGAKLPRKQEAAIAALLSHRSIEEAANSIGVSPNTLRRWLEIPHFKEAYLQARRDAVSHAYARLQQNSGAAGSLLMKLLADATTTASTRVQAARSILEFASKSLETEDLLLRLARLEKSDQKRGPV